MSTAGGTNLGLDALPKEQNIRKPLSQRVLGCMNGSPGSD